MMNLQNMFYLFGLLGILLLIFNNTSPSFESDPYNTHTLDNCPHNQCSSPHGLTPQQGKGNAKENLARTKENKLMSPPTLQDRGPKKMGKNNNNKGVGSFPKKQESSNKKAKSDKSDEKTIDNLIKNIDENDPLKKRVAYALESQRKSRNNNGDKHKSTVDKTQKTSKPEQIKEFSVPISILKKEGPFKNLLQTLGAYPTVPKKYFNSRAGQKPHYEIANYGIYNDEDYCQLADLYNLEHPENMFKRMTFFTDYEKNGLSRKDVIREIGHDLSPRISIEKPETSKSKTINIDQRTTMFYVEQSTFHLYHKMGKHFLCATQMYNRIPGHGAMTRKDLVANNVNAYALRYKDKKTCFNKNEFMPQTYRLYIKEECKEFIKILNSESARRFERQPMYVVKSADNHAGIMNFHQASLIKEMYDDGTQCGQHKDVVIVQKYINNPLLLDFNNKFNLRIYILIASTNPLIAFYHDGLVRASLFPYSQNDIDKNVHLTNTHLSKDIFAETSTLTRRFHGMTEAEIRDYQIWTFERLETYLFQTGIINELGWVKSYLKPKLKQAAIHLVKMSESSLWSQSNIFELFGVDFLVDEELKLWFMECNSVGRLAGNNQFQTKFLINMLKDVFEIQYAYYRSRMKRVVEVLKDLENEYTEMGSVNYGKWKIRYNKATKNRLEKPEYEISKSNSFERIINMNLEGSKAYFGILKNECIDD